MFVKGIFEGATINTPSMLCVEDYIDALKWADQIGGLDALISISEANLKVVSDWVNKTEWASFLAKVGIEIWSLCLNTGFVGARN